eukprot:TRINITY_DN17777_c0_g1_i1.p1 TRINITY_DN17777_c0_g1~~TRINITY_DN17777_c0_g1_i1.p1  ORF type:complete len:360 (-),score=72.16 TRINITY_DN17777_c0_g1_i1:50-1129(-)
MEKDIQADPRIIICIQESKQRYDFFDVSTLLKEDIQPKQIYKITPKESMKYNTVLVLENLIHHHRLYKICKKQWFTNQTYFLLWNSAKPDVKCNWVKVATMARNTKFALNESIAVSSNFEGNLEITFDDTTRSLTPKTTCAHIPHQPFFQYHSLVGPIGRSCGVFTLFPNLLNNGLKEGMMDSGNLPDNLENTMPADGDHILHFAVAICSMMISVREDDNNGRLVPDRPKTYSQFRRLIFSYYNDIEEKARKERRERRASKSRQSGSGARVGKSKLVELAGSSLGREVSSSEKGKEIEPDVKDPQRSSFTESRLTESGAPPPDEVRASGVSMVSLELSRTNRRSSLASPKRRYSDSSDI